MFSMINKNNINNGTRRDFRDYISTLHTIRRELFSNVHCSCIKRVQKKPNPNNACKSTAKCIIFDLYIRRRVLRKGTI